MIRGSLRSCAIALTLLGVSIAPSGAVTIPPGGGAPGTAIPLGSNPLASITLTSPTSVTTDFFFTPSVAGTTFLSAFEGTSAGGSSLNPFSITLLNLTTSTTVGANNAPVANVTQLSLQLSGLPFISGDNYELIVSATASGTDTFPVSIDGNITVNAVNPVPLPPAAWLFGTALVGLGILARRRRTQLAV